MKTRLQLLFLLIPVACFSQVKITGSAIAAADAKPVAGATVFLNNTTSFNQSANDGSFTLTNIKPGRYDLLIAIPGFALYRQAIIVAGQDTLLPVIKLSEAFKPAIAAAIQSSKQLLKLQKDFQVSLLGNSYFAKDCTIVNPDSVTLSVDEKNKQLFAGSVGFLIIENRALGYRMRYLLSRFIADKHKKLLVNQGYTLFEELSGTDEEKLKWAKNRLACYQGSLMHFLRSVIKDQAEAQGFEVYKSVKTLKPDYITPIEYKLPDSILVRDAYFSTTDKPGLYSLTYPVLNVIYKNTIDYGRTSVYKAANMPDWYTNVITLNQPGVLFDSNGVLMDPTGVSFTGYWSLNSITELLPVDYEPK